MPPTLTTVASTVALSSAYSLTVNTTAVGDVVVVAFAGQTTAGVSVNTTAATELVTGTAIQGDDSLWIFLPSATGAQTVVSTKASANRGMMVAEVWTNVGATAVISTAANSTVNSSAVSVVLSSAAANNIAIGAFFIGNAGVSTAGLTSGAGMIVDAKVQMSSAGSTQVIAMTHKDFSSATETLAMLHGSTANWDALGFILAGTSVVVSARGIQAYSFF